MLRLDGAIPPSRLPGARVLIERRPLGVVAAITYDLPPDVPRVNAWSRVRAEASRWVNGAPRQAGYRAAPVMSAATMQVR